MFTPATVIDGLAPLLGFRQPPTDAPDEPQLLPALLAAAGAVAVQDLHPLLTLANIRASAQQVPATGDNIGAQLSHYLDQQRRAAVGKVLTAFAARRKLAGTGRAVLVDTALTGQHGEYRNKVIKQGRFVGLALRPTGGDVLVSISGLGTQFTERSPNFRLYLYHSGSPTEPLASYEVPRTERVYFEWTPLAIALPAGPAGGEYRLGYFEDDMVGQAVELQRNFSQRPGTGGCCGSDYLNFDAYAPYVAVRAFTCAAEAGTDVLPGDGQPTYVADSNFGLNLRLSAVCDLSAYFVRNYAVFVPALQAQLAVDLLQVMANSTRNSGLKSDVQVLALKELNNRPEGQPGLLSDLATALAALDVDMTGVSKQCLPCKPTGYRVGAV